MFSEIIVVSTEPPSICSRKLHETDQSLQSFLLHILPDNSNYPYTTFLTNDFEPEIHLARLNYLPSAQVSEASFRLGLEAATAEFPGRNVRLMAVNRFGSLLVLAEPVEEPLLRPQPVQVKLALCSELPRPQPEFKTTAWLQERQLKFPLPDGFEEIVLGMKEDGGLLEGLSSNFWVIKGSLSCWRC